MKKLIKPRATSANKSDYGHAYLIVGSIGKMGAAIVASKACMRSGVGKLTVNIPKYQSLMVSIAIPEAMYCVRRKNEYNFNLFSAIGMGCGIGTSKKSKKILIHLIAKCTKPMVFDADALNIISEAKALLKKIPTATIITPHPKEFDRLFGLHKTTEERITTAIIKAKQYKIIIVLKGHKTFITYNGTSFLNTTGNVGLAKAGSGDALTGMITAFLAQGYKPFDAAKIAVYLHGFAADFTLENQSVESMLISDVIKNIGIAFKKIVK